MIRQAHSYLAGAISGSALIAAAVVAFIALVSMQALRDWPLAGIGGGDSGSVSSGEVAGGDAAAPTGAPAGAGAANPSGRGRDGNRSGTQVRESAGGLITGSVPTAGGDSPPVAGDPGSAPGSDGSPGSTASPTASAPAAAGSGVGNGSGGGGGLKLPVGEGGGGGGSSSSGSTSGAVTGAVNETVTGVDKAVGGALSETGVTEVTESVVDGVAGPESTVAKTVDQVVETVGGLLGGKR